MAFSRIIGHDFSWINFKLPSPLSFPLQIYTEWANYYLERHKSKRKVTDLSMDARDGLLLAEIIEAVTSFKVPDLIKKPKNQQQMVSGCDAINQIADGSVDCHINVVRLHQWWRRIWKINREKRIGDKEVGEMSRITRKRPSREFPGKQCWRENLRTVI